MQTIVIHPTLWVQSFGMASIILAFAVGLAVGYVIWKRGHAIRNNAQDKKKQQNKHHILEYAKKHKRITVVESTPITS